ELPLWQTIGHTITMNQARAQAQAVRVVSNTWARDSHDLFDFEATDLHRKTFTALRQSIFVRSGTDVQMMSDPLLQLAPSCDPLLRLAQRDGAFWVDRANHSGNKKLWLVVRDMPGSVHHLNEGDVIKLGRFKFRVRQLVGAGNTQPELKLDESGTVCSVNPEGETELAQTLCRICLLEGPGEGDPLITPCQCKGSIEYVHLGCLRHWIRGRLNLSDSSGGSYFYRPLPCELCKAVYPTYMQNHENPSETMPLVEVPWTQPPFIVLENMVRDSQQHACRGLHVISLAEKVLKLGRGHESDVRIADVSISRCHAMIRFQLGRFQLEDNNSKFGTLVAMKKPRLLEPGQGMSIQMGRTVLSLLAHADLEAIEAPTPLRRSLSNGAADERQLRLALLGRGAGARPDGWGTEQPGEAAQVQRETDELF
ncbi:unnamed protein product, partial [Prorocentrum cordatum]